MSLKAKTIRESLVRRAIRMRDEGLSIDQISAQTRVPSGMIRYRLKIYDGKVSDALDLPFRKAVRELEALGESFERMAALCLTSVEKVEAALAEPINDRSMAPHASLLPLDEKWTRARWLVGRRMTKAGMPASSIARRLNSEFPGHQISAFDVIARSGADMWERLSDSHARGD